MTVAIVGREHELFLNEVREQLASNPVQRELTKLWESNEREPDPRPLYDQLGDLGLLAVNWPVEYGGRGRGLIEAALVTRELVRAGVPDTLHVNTIQIVGLFLLLAGSPEQKARYLPPFARGQEFASVLYTEPGSGSDLGSLRTTAVEDGNGYRINGTKIFSLKSDITDVGLCAARTSNEETKYAGITLFLVDLRAEGVRRSIVPSIADEQFHRIELHDVHVPRDAVIGEVGEGWPLLSKALAIERTGLDYTLKAEKWHDAVMEGLVEEVVGDALRVELGRYGAAVDAGWLLTWSVLDQLTREEVDEPRTAAAKYYSSELAQDVALWAARVHGLAYGRRSLSPQARRVLEPAYREAPGLTLSAGTSEVMLQIVASAGLGRDSATDDQPDEIRRDLRAALRSALEAVPGVTDVNAPPGIHGHRAPAWPVLLRFNAPKLELTAEYGGLELGLGAAALVCEELGRIGHGSPYLGVALALHALTMGSDENILLEALSQGRVIAAPAGFEGAVVTGNGGRLAGTVIAPTVDADVFCIPVRFGDERALVLLERKRLLEEPLALEDGSALLPLEGVMVDAASVSCRGNDEKDVREAARVRQAAYLLGLAEGAQAEAVRHADRREQFGQPLRAFQSISFRLADAHVRLQTLRLLVYAAAEGRTEAADALGLAAETALFVTRMAMQVCGARALTPQTALHRLYRLARTEAVRFGTIDSLWAESGTRRLARAKLG